MKDKITSDQKLINIQSKVFEKLIFHLQKRTDVQNIDLMNLSGFCRNCLSKWYSEAAKDEGLEIDKWYSEAAKDEGLEIDYETSREKVYGMSYEIWKNKFQNEASQDQINKFNKK